MTETLYQCPACGLHYTDAVIAKQCEEFCTAYNSCSLEITLHSVERQQLLRQEGA